LPAAIWNTGLECGLYRAELRVVGKVNGGPLVCRPDEARKKVQPDTDRIRNAEHE
jgi:hypothetical protein